MRSRSEKEGKPRERETVEKRAEEMNNKCIMLESIFKGGLEELGCTLGCSHDPNEGGSIVGHLH